PITLEIIFNFYQKRNIPESLRTLKRMGNGGIFDHVDGGFHRYSIDDKWLVPHFEKMLYDNALLLDAFSQAYLLTNDAFFKEKASMIYKYLTKRLYTTNGFYSAQDADSEGEEGKYYVFSFDEIKSVVKHFDLIKNRYNVTKQGNFEGKNILNVDTRQSSSLSASDREKLEDDLARLQAYREKRVPPATDTKIITCWNGLAISGIARYALACDDEAALLLAARLGSTYMEQMVDKGKILRIFGKETIRGFLEDHAALANAFIDLHEATRETRFLDAAKKVIDWAAGEFWHDDGFLAESGKNHEALFSADTRVHDAVTPSGASLFLLALLKLDALDPGQRYGEMLETCLKAHYPALVSRPSSIVLMVMVLWGFLGHLHAITVPEPLATSQLLTQLHRLPAFNKIVKVTSISGKQISVCTGTACKIATDARDVLSIIEQS
nr:hypothetical protein [Candidatus Sigynarchaeota archaeon]